MITLAAKPQADRGLCREAAQRLTRQGFSGRERSRSCRPTSSARFSTSACPRRSTSRSSAISSRPTASWRTACWRNCAACAASSTRASSSRATNPRSTSTSTARGRCRRACMQRDVVAESADRAVRQLADHAEFLARSEERRQLSADGDDAAVRHPLAADAGQYSGGASGSENLVQVPRRQSPLAAQPAESARRARHDCRAALSRPSSRTTTCRPVLDIFASAQGRDLGGVAADVNASGRSGRPQLPPGASIVVRGQVQAMHDSFAGLASGSRVRDRARLYADGHQFPVVARSVRSSSAACRARSRASRGCCSAPAPR